MTVSIQKKSVAKLCPVCRELTRHGMNADVHLASPAIDANIKVVKWLRGQSMTLTTFRLPLALCGKLSRPGWCTRRAQPRWLICTVSCRFRALSTYQQTRRLCTLTQCLSIRLSCRVSVNESWNYNLVWVVLLMFQIVPNLTWRLGTLTVVLNCSILNLSCSFLFS